MAGTSLAYVVQVLDQLEQEHFTALSIHLSLAGRLADRLAKHPPDHRTKVRIEGGALNAATKLKVRKPHPGRFFEWPTYWTEPKLNR